MQEPNNHEVRNEEPENNVQSFVIINSVDGGMSQQAGMQTILAPGGKIYKCVKVVSTNMLQQL